MPNGRHEPSAIEHNPSKARREALSAILLLLLVLLILLLIAAATERTDILRFAGAIIGSGSVLAFQPRLSPPNVAFTPGSAAESASLSATAVARQVYDIDPLFQTFYDQQNGALWFGHPISPLLDRAGQPVQWFERGRLEYTAGADGGQVAIRGERSTVRGARKRLLKGLGRLSNTQIYVNRGLGTVVLPIRYGCPPEISLLELRSSSS